MFHHPPRYVTPGEPTTRSQEIWQTRLQRELLALQESPPLPPFLHVGDVTILLEHGVCNVQFRIDLEDKEVEVKNKSVSLNNNDTNQDGVQEDSPSTRYIMVMIDASIRSDEESGEGSMQYPFLHPVALLISDPSSSLSPGSAQSGDRLPLDCDWTPSLHLSDAAVNVGLRIREAVRTGTPLPVVKRLRKEERVENAAELLHVGSVISLEDMPNFKMYSCRCVQRPQNMKAMLTDASQQTASSSEHIGNAPIWDSLPSGEEEEDGTGDNYMRLRAGNVRKVARDGLFGASSLFKGFVKRVDQNVRQVMEESFLMVRGDTFLEVRANKLNLGRATVTLALPVPSLIKLKFRRNESLSLYFNVDHKPMIYICHDSAAVVSEIQSVMKRLGVEGKHTHTSMVRALAAGENILKIIGLKERELEVRPTVENVDEIMDLYRQAAEKFGISKEGEARRDECMVQLRSFLEKPSVMAILECADTSTTQSADSPPSMPHGSSDRMEIPLPHGIPAGEVIESTLVISSPEDISSMGINSSNNDDDGDDDDDDDGLAEEEEVIRGIGEVGLEAHIGSPNKSVGGSSSVNKGHGSSTKFLRQTENIVEEARRDMELSRSLMLSLDRNGSEDDDVIENMPLGDDNNLNVLDELLTAQESNIDMEIQLDNTRDAVAELDAMLSDAEGKLASVLAKA